MQDIDFDEIDRAVSSVTGVNTPVVPSSASVVNVSTPTNVSEPVSISTPTPVPVSSPAARRSSGRFMDVVHPSSDMRPGAPTTVPQREEVPVVTERPDVVTRPEPAAPASTAFHWPDPIDVASSTPLDENIPSSVEVADIPTPEIPEDSAPLESPFLTDAKVEKRPLGAFSSNDTESDLPLLEDFPAPATSTPVETTSVEEVLVTEGTPEASEDTKEDTLLEVPEEDEPELPPAEPSTTIEDVPVGPTSITQQYKEQPSTAAQESGSIYDTEAYHQPLVHPVKKSSSILVIVWIVALILVGGGMGAGIYFFVLPMLG